MKQSPQCLRDVPSTCVDETNSKRLIKMINNPDHLAGPRGQDFDALKWELSLGALHIILVNV